MPPAIEPPGEVYSTFDAVPVGDEGSSTDARAQLRAFLRSTPAKLTVLGIVLALLTLIAGIFSAYLVNDRKHTIDDLLATTEPLANSAQNLYSALSVADAAAATGFISGGIEPKPVRDRYEQSIGEASVQLVTASGGVPLSDAVTRRLLASVSTELTAYTGLIETARANNRVGNPVGAAYLAEASNLMQMSLLPMAQELHTRGVAAVAATQQQSARPPWLAISLLLLSAAALATAHVLIAKRSRRTFNVGLVVALVAIGILLCWLLIAGLISSTATQRGIQQGAQPLSVLTDSRILAQQARTDETLQLVRRDAGGGQDGSFDENMTRLGELLGGYAQGGSVRAATEEANRAAAARNLWLQSHERMRAALDRGDFPAAAILAIGPGPDESAAQFMALDQALTDGIVSTRTALRTNVAQAADTLSALAPAALALTFLALFGITIGLWPRLREYQ